MRYDENDQHNDDDHDDNRDDAASDTIRDGNSIEDCVWARVTILIGQKTKSCSDSIGQIKSLHAGLCFFIGQKYVSGANPHGAQNETNKLT